MGEIAEGILNGDFDQFTGEYLGEGDGYPRSHEDIYNNPNKIYNGSSKKVRQIRKELAILIKSKLKSCTTEKEERIAVEKSRQEINIKYGKSWRLGIIIEPKIDRLSLEYLELPGKKKWSMRTFKKWLSYKDWSSEDKKEMKENFNGIILFTNDSFTFLE